MVKETIKDTIKLNLPCKPEYVMVARMAISAVANKMEFDIEEIDDIKVAVGEACNNAILHGGGEDKTYEVRMILGESYLQIEVQDKGEGFNIEDCESPDLCNPKVGGLGIFIIKTLMDNVDVSSNEEGTTIVMRKNLISTTL